jgi:hypothetical protein
VEVEGNDSMPSGLDDEDPALGARDSGGPLEIQRDHVSRPQVIVERNHASGLGIRHHDPSTADRDADRAQEFAGR